MSDRLKENLPGSTAPVMNSGVQSKPLLGVLPLARLLPQDMHSVIDYAGSVVIGCGAFLTNNDPARWASISMMLFGLAVSLITDYRISLIKIIPIEAHEVLDYGLGSAMIAMPFLLGYWHAAILTAGLHALGGVSLIGMALITDYRACQRRATTPAMGKRQ